MKLFVRSINTPRPPRVWSTDGEVHVSLDTDGTGMVMTPEEASAFAVNLRAAAGKPAVPSVPEGWVLVPMEPTRDMLWAGGEAPADPAARLSGCQAGAVWRAMINAATLHPAHTIEFARDTLAAAPVEVDGLTPYARGVAAINSLDDFARMDSGVDPVGPRAAALSALDELARDAAKAEHYITAAEEVARVYFDIASEAIGEDEVRRIRDDRIVSVASFRKQLAAANAELVNLRAANIAYASEVANLHGRAGLAEEKLAAATPNDQREVA